MKKNKVITLTIVALLGLGTVGATNEVTNVTAQAKTTHVSKKTHKKHVTKKATKKTTKKLTKEQKELQELRDQINHPEKYKKQSSQNATTKTSDTIVNGQDTKTGNVVDANAYYNAFRNEVLSEINSFRTQKGLNTVQTTSVLNTIADTRVSQLNAPNASFTHYDTNGTAFVNELAAQNGLYANANDAQPHMAENATRTTITGNPIDDAKSLMDTFIGEGPENGDGNEHGHYENLADSTHNYVGIGVGLTDDNSTATLVLDFQSLGTSNMVM